MTDCDPETEAAIRRLQQRMHDPEQRAEMVRKMREREKEQRRRNHFFGSLRSMVTSVPR